MNTELFNELHNEEEFGLFGKLHIREYHDMPIEVWCTKCNWHGFSNELSNDMACPNCNSEIESDVDERDFEK